VNPLQQSSDSVAYDARYPAHHRAFLVIPFLPTSSKDTHPNRSSIAVMFSISFGQKNLKISSMIATARNAIEFGTEHAVHQRLLRNPTAKPLSLALSPEVETSGHDNWS
jgi:hypothetical protein